MKTRLTALLVLLPIALSTQQPTKPPVSTKAPSAAKPASQILDENRDSIAVIVAGGNTSVRLGTGFFVGSTGLLVTNFHVVEGTDLVGVKIPTSNEVFWAKTATGFDLDNDLIVLKVETTTRKPVSIGDSDQAKVGEQIVVVGNPEGLEQTVSNGLLSGIRELDGRRLFQISAPISEGSSGSPVFNARGEVIGVVVSTLESGQNLNFAVPVNYAKPLLSRTTEKQISALPKRTQNTGQPVSGNTAAGPTTDPAALAVQAMSRIADRVRACEGFSEIIPTKEKKPHYSRVHSDSPKDVRFDVTPSDSLVASFQGILEFSVHRGVSLYLRTAEEAASAADNPMLSKTTWYRYFYRINGSSAQIDRRTYYDTQEQKWFVLEQAKSDRCVEGAGAP
jgi:S1-C subfamily serine protease